MATTKEKNNDRLLSLEQVADILAVSRRTVYRFRDSGFMPPAIKLGRMLRWRESEIQEWITAGCPHFWRTQRPKQNTRR